MSKVYKTLAVLLLALGFFVISGDNSEAMAAAKKKTSQSYLKKTTKKIKRNIKKSVKKAKRACVKAGCAATNKIMDGAVKAKSKLTGKKPAKTWVKGHYKKGNKKHTKGHFRQVSKKGKSSGKKTSSNSGSSYSAPAAYTPLPPSQDPVLPNFNRSKK